MKNLEKVLDKKSEQELTEKSTKYPDSTLKSESISNLIEPTSAMIEQVLEKLISGETNTDIKKSVKKKGTNQTLSFGQIAEIEKAWRSKLSEFAQEDLEVLSEEVVEG